MICVGDTYFASYQFNDLFDVIEDELGERTVGFRLDDDDLVDLVTVADIIEYVTNIVGRRPC